MRDFLFSDPNLTSNEGRPDALLRRFRKSKRNYEYHSKALPFRLKSIGFETPRKY